MRVLLIGGMNADPIDCSEMDELINYDVPSEIEEYRSRNKRSSKKTKNSHSLPRPIYDGLSDAREGNGWETGLFGWVKELFK